MEFDLVFLDVNLPDGLGTDLLKENAFPAHAAVIVMTAEADMSGAVTALRLGAADYLAKPFELGELPLVVNRARKARQSARADEHRRESVTNAPARFSSSAPRSPPLEKQPGKNLRRQTAVCNNESAAQSSSKAKPAPANHRRPLAA